jgi:heat shock protein HslJ
VSDGDALAGKWVVTAFLREGALARTLPDTEITLVLADDGSLIGSGGCNVYRSMCVANGGSIEIAALFTTRKFCAEPEGVTEQEAAYLEVLPQARSYRLDGDTLHMLAAEGPTVAELTRVG